MASTISFNRVVAARTRAARHILNDPGLLATYKKYGGLDSDLEAIIESGDNAELLSRLRGATQADGSAATMTVLQKLAETQRSYVEVMAVLQAVRRDLEIHHAPADQLAAVDKILDNEVPVVLRDIDKPDGSKRKVAVRSKSQEGTRAEIQKDAGALLEMKDVLKLMAKRGVTATRIKSLHDGAADLAGKLAVRAAAKGAGVGATADIRRAVQEQKRVWSACYRILALVGMSDQRVHSLLSDASATP